MLGFGLAGPILQYSDHLWKDDTSSRTGSSGVAFTYIYYVLLDRFLPVVSSSSLGSGSGLCTEIRAKAASSVVKLSSAS